MTNECFWKDGLHLINDGTYIFVSNLVEFLNAFVFKRSIWLTKDDNTNLGKENCKQGSAKTTQSNKIDFSKNVTCYKQWKEGRTGFGFCR